MDSSTFQRCRYFFSDCLRNVARSSNGGTCEILTAIHNNGYLGPKAIDGIAVPGNALLMNRVDGKISELMQ